MKEIKFDQPLLEVFRRQIFERECLSRVGLVLALYYDLHGKSSCIVKHEDIINPNTHRAEPVNSCGMYLIYEKESSNTPVNYRRERQNKWIISVNPSVVDLSEEQQNMAFTYAASRTFTQTKEVEIEIDKSIDPETRKRARRLIRFVSKIK